RGLQLQDGQALAQGGGRQRRGRRVVDVIVHQTEDEQPAEVRRLTQGQRGGPQAVLAQVHLQQRVGRRRPGQECRPVVEQVVVAHQQRVERRWLPLQQGGQADRAEMVVADGQPPQAIQEL